MPDEKLTGAASIVSLDNSLANEANNPNDLENMASPVQDDEKAVKAALPDLDDDFEAEESRPSNPVVEAEKPKTAPDSSSAPTDPARNWDDPANPYRASFEALQQIQIAQAAQALDAQLQQQGFVDENVRKTLIGVAMREYQIEQQARQTVLAQASEELKGMGFEFSPAQLSAFETPAALQTFMQTMRTQKRADNFQERKERRADVVDSPQGVGGAEVGANYSGGLIAQGLREYDRRNRR